MGYEPLYDKKTINGSMEVVPKSDRVKEMAAMLANQLHYKSAYHKRNNILVPIGDDFR